MPNQQTKVHRYAKVHWTIFRSNYEYLMQHPILHLQWIHTLHSNISYTWSFHDPYACIIFPINQYRESEKPFLLSFIVHFNENQLEEIFLTFGDALGWRDCVTRILTWQIWHKKHRVPIFSGVWLVTYCFWVKAKIWLIISTPLYDEAYTSLCGIFK